MWEYKKRKGYIKHLHFSVRQMEEPLFDSIYSLYCKHMLRNTSGAGSSVCKLQIEVWVESQSKRQCTDNTLVNKGQEDLWHQRGDGHWETQQEWRTQEEEQDLHRT